MTAREDPCHVSAVLESGVVRPDAKAHVVATIRNDSSRAVRKISLQLIQTISVNGNELPLTIYEREYSSVGARGELSDAWFALAIVESASEQVPPSTPHVGLFAMRYTLRMKCRFAYCRSVVVEFPVTAVARESAVAAARAGSMVIQVNEPSAEDGFKPV